MYRNFVLSPVLHRALVAELCMQIFRDGLKAGHSESDSPENEAACSRASIANGILCDIREGENILTDYTVKRLDTVLSELIAHHKGYVADCESRGISSAYDRNIINNMRQIRGIMGTAPEEEETEDVSAIDGESPTATEQDGGDWDDGPNGKGRELTGNE